MRKAILEIMGFQLRKQFEHFDDGSDDESGSISSASSRSDEETHSEAIQVLNHNFTNGETAYQLTYICNRFSSTFDMM